MRFFHVPCRDLTDVPKRCIIGASKYPEAKRMPIIVDREQIRTDILMAFERCIERKPMLSVSLRDIAAEAGMSHAKLLNYFESKNDLVLAYVRYTREYMSEKCSQWFAAHARADYASNLAYMNAFMDYVANAPSHEQRPSATTQTYVLARYDPEIGQLVQDEFRAWRTLMEQCLVRIYGQEAGMHEAEAMMILIAGTFICNYNRALTGEINDNILGYLGNLSRS